MFPTFSPCYLSNSRIRLLRWAVIIIRGPRLTPFIVVLHHPRLNILTDVRRPFNELQRQARARVPSDMAMHEPYPRVVGLKSDDQVPIDRQHGDVPPRRILGNDGIIACIERVAALGEDDEVMPVQVDGMRGRDGVAVRSIAERKDALNDEVDPIIIGTVDEDGCI